MIDWTRRVSVLFQTLFCGFRCSNVMSKTNVPQYVYEPYNDGGSGYAPPVPAATSNYAYPSPPSGGAPPPPPPPGGVAYAYGSGPPPPPPPSYRYVYSETASDGTTRHYYYFQSADGNYQGRRRYNDDPHHAQAAQTCAQMCCEGIAIGACSAATFACCLALCGLY